MTRAAPAAGGGTARAARERGVFGELATRRWIAVQGPDAASHLHAMLTQSLVDLPPGGAAYAALVDDRAHYLADAWVLRPGEEWVLDAPAAVADRLAGRLTQFAVSADVELVSLGETHSLFHFEGKCAPAVAGELGLGQELEAAGAGEALGARFLWARRSHFGEPGVTLAVTRGDAGGFATALGAACVAAGLLPDNPELAERLRLEAGRIEGGRDVTEEHLLPEAGLWAAVSLDKGCYPGQEILQRVARLGQLKRRLVGLRWRGESAYAGGDSPILADERGAPIGHATSWASVPELGGGVALGWARVSALGGGSSLRLVAGGESLPCQVAEAPFLATTLGRLAETPRPAPAGVLREEA